MRVSCCCGFPERDGLRSHLAPRDDYLQQADNDSFTEIMIPLVVKAIFSEFPPLRQFSFLALKYLSAISPSLVLDPLMKSTDGCVDNLTEVPSSSISVDILLF